MTRGRALLESVAMLVALLALWWVASHAKWLSPVFVPTPEGMLDSLREGLVDGELAAQTGATVLRMLLGWGLACAAGVALGALIGISAAARAWLQPTLEFVRPLPASAVLPLAISIFGLSPSMVLAVVAFGAMWPVLLATVHGFASVHERLREVSEALQLSRAAYVFKVGSGLGQAILLAARAFRASELFAGIALLGAIGFVSNALLAVAERRLLRWQHP
ncbi:MAG: ABC transporter permease subunit [Comamonadaceae bacterium]|nr:MAG: ABC transporter permease subunit [Comamonadaceae bacterium]